MVNIGSTMHQETITIVLKELKKLGYRVIDLRGLCPDALAIKSKNDVVAIESLLGDGAMSLRRRADSKVRLYCDNLDVDDVFVFGFNRDGRLIMNSSDWFCSMVHQKNPLICKKVMAALGDCKVHEIESSNPVFDLFFPHGMSNPPKLISRGKL